MGVGIIEIYYYLCGKSFFMKYTVLYFFAAAALMLAACTKQLPQANYDVIPQPKEILLSEESKAFTLNEKTTVYYEEGLQREAQLFSEYVNDIMGFVPKVQAYQSQPDGIVLKVVADDFDQAEAYEINITPKQVRINGADAAGVFHGVQTLRKSLPAANGQLPTSNLQPPTANCQLPTGTIRDWPDFPYRGMHLDPCRHFMDLDSVKIYIDMLALHNMNQFHFHLSEDQGWRIEIKKYPKLTEKGSVRPYTVVGDLHSPINDGTPHGGFYTQDEIREIVLD
jgi:hexosaminidase